MIPNVSFQKFFSFQFSHLAIFLPCWIGNGPITSTFSYEKISFIPGHGENDSRLGSYLKNYNKSNLPLFSSGKLSLYLQNLSTVSSAFRMLPVCRWAYTRVCMCACTCALRVHVCLCRKGDMEGPVDICWMFPIKGGRIKSELYPDPAVKLIPNPLNKSISQLNLPNLTFGP